MTQEYERLVAWGHRQINGKAAIEAVRKIWHLGEEEGYVSERGRLAADAAWVAAAHMESVFPRSCWQTLLILF
jgi:hypothetical protein